MRRDQSKASSSHHLSMSNTSQAHWALHSRNGVEPRHERLKPNNSPGQIPGTSKTYNSNEEPTLGAEEPDNTQPRRKNHNETYAQLNEARCVTPKATNHGLRPHVHSPMVAGHTDQQICCPLDDVSFDTQVDALKIATIAPHVWSLESMGSHLDSQNVGYAGPPSPGDVSEDEHLISDTETHDSVNRSLTVSSRRSRYQTDHYADTWP
jgi:hypothetical protein